MTAPARITQRFKKDPKGGWHVETFVNGASAAQGWTAGNKRDAVNFAAEQRAAVEKEYRNA